MKISVNCLKNRYLWSYGAAILLHVFLFFAQVPSRLFSPSPEAAPSVDPPLVFEFVEPPEALGSDPEPDPTPLVSDRDRISRDRETAALPRDHLPASAGISQARDAFETTHGDRDRSYTPSAEPRVPADQENPARDRPFDFGEVLRGDAEQVRRQREQAILGRVSRPSQSAAMSNPHSRALEEGGLQLSTYAWDFAPYMAYLKDHIGNYIFLPRAFDLGLIDGTTQVKFRIKRDGRLDGLQVLGFKGSPMLRDTSAKAVALAADFRPLPTDFPDEYLEVIGTFEYIIVR